MSLLLEMTSKAGVSEGFSDVKVKDLVPTSIGQTAAEGVNTWAWVDWRHKNNWGKWMWYGGNEEGGKSVSIDLPSGPIKPTPLPELIPSGGITTEERDAPENAFDVRGCGTVVPRQIDLVLAGGLQASLLATVGLVASVIDWVWTVELVSVILSVIGWILAVTWLEFLRNDGPYGVMRATVVGLLVIWPISWVPMVLSLTRVAPTQLLRVFSLILHLTSSVLVFGRITTGLTGRDEKRAKVSTDQKIHATCASLWLANVISTTMEVANEIKGIGDSSERPGKLLVYSDRVEVTGDIDFSLSSILIHKVAALVVIENGMGSLSGPLTGFCLPSELTDPEIKRPQGSDGVEEDFNAVMVWGDPEYGQMFDLSPGGVVASHTGTYVVQGSFMELSGQTGAMVRPSDEAFARLDYHTPDGGKVEYAVLGLLGVLNTILSGAFLLVSTLGPLWWVVATNLVGEVVAIGVSLEAWLVGGGRLFTYCSDPIHASFDWSDGRFRYTLRVLVIEAFCAVLGMLILISGGVWSEAVVNVAIGFAAILATGVAAFAYRGPGALIIAYVIELVIEVTLPFAVDKISWAVILVSASALLETFELMIVAERLIRARETRPGHFSVIYHSVRLEEWAKSLTVSSGLYFAFFGERFEPVDGRGVAIPAASRASVVAKLSSRGGSNASLHCEGVTYAGAVMTVVLHGETTTFRTCSARQKHSGFCSAVAVADRGVYYPLMGDRTRAQMSA